MNIEILPGQLGFDHSLQVRRSPTGVSRELRDGDAVQAGDRIRVQVQTSVDAYLYLAFCSKQGITMHPQVGGQRTQAGALVVAPEGSELVIDNEPGTEVLYVIASATDLPVADPRLAAALATRRPSNGVQDCGPAFNASLGAPQGATPAVPALLPAPGARIAPAPSVIRGRPVAKRPLPSVTSRAEPPAASAPHTAESPKSAVPTAPPPPDPDFVRHPGNVVWYLGDDTRGPERTPRVEDSLQVTAADSSGIAVVRHEFPHVER